MSTQTWRLNEKESGNEEKVNSGGKKSFGISYCPATIGERVRLADSWNTYIKFINIYTKFTVVVHVLGTRNFQRTCHSQQSRKNIYFFKIFDRYVQKLKYGNIHAPWGSITAWECDFGTEFITWEANGKIAFFQVLLKNYRTLCPDTLKK